jgi:hypothetical protein
LGNGKNETDELEGDEGMTKMKLYHAGKKISLGIVIMLLASR